MLRTHRFGIRALRALCALALFAACAPKVQLEAPKEPITINMNIKIDHEIRVKVDKDLDQLADKNPELF
jgi:YnbE-like lipoprotein